MTANARKSKAVKRIAGPSKARYVVCIVNDGYAASLEKRKIYRTLPDSTAGGHSLLRVVDESGEDYLYPAEWFVTLSASPALAKALALAA